MSNSRRSHGPREDSRRRGRQPTVSSSRNSGRSRQQQEPLSLHSPTTSTAAPSIKDEQSGIATTRPEDSSRDHHFGYWSQHLPDNSGSADSFHQKLEESLPPSYPALATQEMLPAGTETSSCVSSQLFGEDTSDAGACLDLSMLVESRSVYSPGLPAINETQTCQQLTDTGSNNDWRIISIVEEYMERNQTYPDSNRLVGPTLSRVDCLFPSYHRLTSPYPRQLDNDDFRDLSVPPSANRHPIDADYALDRSFIYDDNSEWDYCDEYQ